MSSQLIRKRCCCNHNPSEQCTWVYTTPSGGIFWPSFPTPGWNPWPTVDPNGTFYLTRTEPCVGCADTMVVVVSGVTAHKSDPWGDCNFFPYSYKEVLTHFAVAVIAESDKITVRVGYYSPWFNGVCNMMVVLEASADCGDCCNIELDSGDCATGGTPCGSCVDCSTPPDCCWLHSGGHITVTEG
ncbi:hypothetical protein LCGC14_2070410 [marine sediment metagenome]|uniref:Uncharacterized protein n=1 Tax=marine sediment metagenome TaxID=412755 RepID=A0A0F9EIH1_9ZZZZ